MYIVATQIRVGMVLIVDNELYRVTWTMHRTPGKGNACMQTKLKHIITGKNMEKRYLSSDKANKAELETHAMQYLYKDSEGLLFMDNETFDQFALPVDIIEDCEQFLVEGESYPVTMHEGTAVGIELPNSVVLLVTEAPPELKKATASAQLKPVTLENGMIIQAPAFVKEGDRIKVNTETQEYVERA